MFGVDEEAKPAPAVSRPVVALELLVLALGLLACGALWLFTTPAGVQRVVDRLVGDAPLEITVGDVAVVPWSRWNDPATWELVLEDVAVTPDDPDEPRFRIVRVVLGMPDLMRAWATGELRIEQARVVGLAIHAPRQRPPKPWTPKQSALASVELGHVDVWDASYHADADDPLPVADVALIWGELSDVVYSPSLRALSGHGHLRAEHFQTGTLALTHVHVDEIRAKDSDLFLDRASFEVAGGKAALTGEVKAFHRRPEVTLRVKLTGGRAEQMVEMSTGKPSPLLGRVDTELVVYAGGDLPRGESWLEGSIALTDGLLVLGPEVTDLQRDLLDIAPFITLEGEDRVRLGATQGRMRFDRGEVLVHELVYEAPARKASLEGRRIQIWGVVDETQVALTLRLVPLKDDRKAGVGLVISGPYGRPKVRLAKRGELEGAPGVDAAAAAAAKKPLFPKVEGKPLFTKGEPLLRKNDGTPLFQKGEPILPKGEPLFPKRRAQASDAVETPP